MIDSTYYTIPILLDDVAVNIVPWSGYNVLAQNQKMIHRIDIHREITIIWVYSNKTTFFDKFGSWNRAEWH